MSTILVKKILTSKRIIYFIILCVLCIGIYLYINKNKLQDKNIHDDNINDNIPEIVLPLDLVKNLYRNNSDPVKYLKNLQQSGQLPKGLLPRIVIDTAIDGTTIDDTTIDDTTIDDTTVNDTPQNNPIIQKPINFIYDDNLSNQYKQIDKNDNVDQQLTKEDIEEINKRMVNNS